ncbi:MAG TPA: 16S rRNA (uracil(1498)-N(3))-methyltransferase [Geothermobacteraceae bacterium]|nr:16S rRNA (uracil(1498)-N(3))-methyltransferase [Geothermobacteraceae bacterium]
MPGSLNIGRQALTLECSNNGGPASLLQLVESPVQLEIEVAASAATVAALTSWQARPGEIFSVVGSAGDWYRARLLELSSTTACFVPFARIIQSSESSLQLTVCQALPDKERFELVLEKLTELGASRIVPFQSELSTSLAERDARQKKSHRWPDLIVKAAKQCRRGMLPELYPVQSFDQALYLAAQANLKLMLYEGDCDWPLTETLDADFTSSVALLIGPEGGFSAAEVSAARSLGILPVSLGPRILRTETAAITAAAILQHRLGDLR